LFGASIGESVERWIGDLLAAQYLIFIMLNDLIFSQPFLQNV
jgi:hypothetical protein